MSVISHLKTSYYTENGTRYVWMDGNACKKIESCYDLLAEQLSFPDYFGRNLDALQDVMGDLDGVQEEKIKLIISNMNALLMHDAHKKKLFLEILNMDGLDNRVEIIYLGK